MDCVSCSHIEDKVDINQGTYTEMTYLPGSQDRKQTSYSKTVTLNFTSGLPGSGDAKRCYLERRAVRIQIFRYPRKQEANGVANGHRKATLHKKRLHKSFVHGQGRSSYVVFFAER